MFLTLYPRQLVLLSLLLFLLSGLLFCFCFSFFSLFFDGPPGTAGLVTQHVYLAFGCESTQTRTTASADLLRNLSPVDVVASEANYTKSVFLHSSGANLNLCLTYARLKTNT